MRLIDADALLKFVEDRYEITWESDTYEGGIKDACSDIIEKIDNMPTIEPEPHWIPCSERMPELDSDGYSDKVLVCFSNFSDVEICEYRVMNGTGKWYAGDTDDSPEDIGVNVIAWQPLPEPYKEKKNG